MSKRIAALEAEIIMLRACNEVLVKQEQNARVLSNALRAKLDEKNSGKTHWEIETDDMKTTTKAETAPAQSGQHTRGTWKYERAGYGWCILTEDFDEETSTGSCIARLSDLMPEADARLIAAAPKLLAALRRIANDPETPFRFASIARAAINKSEKGVA